MNGELPLRHRLVTWRLTALLNQVRRSAVPAYKRETGLSDFDWRVVAQVGAHGPVSLTDVVTLLGQDKGQVSRAVKRLVKAGLLARERLRGSIVTTVAGKAVFSRIIRLARSRNAVLTRELSDEEMQMLPALLDRLYENAQTLLSSEQGTSAEPMPPESETDLRRRRTLQRAVREGRALIAARRAAGSTQIRRTEDPSDPRDRLVLPELITLLNLLRKSAVTAFRRETGLSDFDWRLISQVGEHSSLMLIQLVPLMNRDKSQVGRAVKRLAAADLLTINKIGGGRHVLLTMSEEGKGIYDRLARLALERNAVLTAGLTPPEQQALMSILDKLTEGAAALLERERALACRRTATPRSAQRNAAGR